MAGAGADKDPLQAWEQALGESSVSQNIQPPVCWADRTRKDEPILLRSRADDGEGPLEALMSPVLGL